MPKIATPKQRFLEKVNKKSKDECWNWKASKLPTGYGRLSLNGKVSYAHRFSWELYNNKKIPKGKHVLHKCNNPSCVNPNHLKVGTHQENIKDREKSGNGFFSNHKGENHPTAKLNSEQVKEIRKRYKEEDITQKELGDEFGVNNRTISTITTKRRWKKLK